MSIEEIIKELEAVVDDCKVNNRDLESRSWQYEEGILISVRQAEVIIEFYNKLNLAS